jgi:hypothetical protein
MAQGQRQGNRRGRKGMTNNNKNDWQDEHFKILKQRQDFELSMANFWLEEEEFNRQGLFDRKTRVVTLYQAV